MFAVFDNNKPAKYPECQVDPSWDKNEYETFQEAVDYAVKWLGKYAVVLSVFERYTPFEVDYSGYGDILSIKQTQTQESITSNSDVDN